MRQVGRTMIVGLLAVLILGALAYPEHLYAFYYTRSLGLDLEANLLNRTASETRYQLNVYDTSGKLLWGGEGVLAAYDAAFHLVSNFVEQNEANWGVVTVSSEGPLLIGLEYSYRGQLLSMDTVTQQLSPPEPGAVYQIGAYHTEVAEGLTALVVMNPWDQPVSGRLRVYKNDGALVHESEMSLSAHQSATYDVAELAGRGANSWGFAEVLTDERSVAVACKYLKGEMWQVANIATVLPVDGLAEPLSSSSESTTEPPTDKQD